ncbi:MAG: DUF3789 domain-containing protein [Bacteroidales bacterium]|nr:DUF3789 domain-containing protein [Bacteroidales bacterium]
MPWRGCHGSSLLRWRGDDDVLTFFIGLFVGGIVGVVTMCLFQINRK